MVEKFWDTVYAEMDDGDAQPRAAPLGVLGTKLEIPLKLAPVVERKRRTDFWTTSNLARWVTRSRSRRDRGGQEQEFEAGRAP